MTQYQSDNCETQYKNNREPKCKEECLTTGLPQISTNMNQKH